MRVYEPIFTYFRRKTGMVWLIFVAFLILITCSIWLWRPFGVLPSQLSMLQMTPFELRSLVLAVTPIGTDRASVERSLALQFRRKWEVIDYEGVELMSRRKFSVPVVDGDYYLSSDFATVYRILATDFVTIRFLFDKAGALKDVAAEVRTVSL